MSRPRGPAGRSGVASMPSMRPGTGTALAGPQAVDTASVACGARSGNGSDRPSGVGMLVNSAGGRRQREVGRGDGPVGHAVGERAAHRCGDEVAGGVVEGLARQRLRTGRAGHPLALGGDAAAHLHQAVEATPAGPRPVPAVARRGGRSTRDGLSAASRPSSKPRRPSASGRSPPTSTSASATRAAKRSRRRRARSSAAQRLPAVVSGSSAPTSCEAGRVDAQHVGAVGGQEARRRRAGDHPSEVEDADAVEWPLRCRPQRWWIAVGRRPRDQRRTRRGCAGRVCRPLGHRAQRRRTPSGGDHRGLQPVGVAPGHDRARPRRGRGRRGRRCRARSVRPPRWWP